jgi:thiol-disulfide isomerase/thioredoxin
VTVDVWCPIIQDSPVQRVVAMALEAPGAYTLTRDPDHGNRMLHAQVPGDHISGFTIRYTVERRSLRPMLDPACVRTLEAPALFHRELSAEQFVDVNEATRALARDVVGAETNILEQARRIYDHVSGRMTYHAAEESWKGRPQLAVLLGSLKVVTGLAAAAVTRSTTPTGTPGGSSRPALAEEFVLETRDKRTVRLSDHRGKVVFLNFWATWCPPCREEMPAMERLRQRTKKESVDVDPKVIASFLREHRSTLMVGLDSKMELANTDGVRALAANFIVAGEGYFAALALGPRAWDHTVSRLCQE